MIDWTHWHNEPYLVGGLIVLGWLYALATGPFRRRFTANAPYPTAHAIKFYAALFIFYIAVGSPLDQIGERFLLSAHMIQHQLLIYGSAVLMLIGLPSWLVAPVMNATSAERHFKILTKPIVCAVIYILTLTVWHAPFFYELALQNKAVHVLEHVMFFGCAVFYWWPILSPSEKFPPLNEGAQILYLLAVTIGMTPLFFFLAFADNVLYPTYEYAPRLFANVTPLNDQIMGSGIMKLGGLFVTFIALVIAFYRWHQLSERASPAHPLPRSS